MACRGLIAADRRRFAEAEQRYQEAFRAGAACAEARAGPARLRIREGRIDLALRELAAVVSGSNLSTDRCDLARGGGTCGWHAGRRRSGVQVIVARRR